jgi:hypothetical protein
MPASSLLVLLLAADLSASVRFEWAQGTANSTAQKVETVIEPELRAVLPFEVDFTAIGRLRADAIDELVPGAPTQHERSLINRQLQIGSNVEWALREFYVRRDFDVVHLTLGKQQVVWGKADGIKVLDVVNPQEFREFILPDFDDSRIPLWTVNAEIPVRDVDIQLLWIPDPTYHDLAPEDGLYVFTTPELIPRPPPGLPVVLRQIDRPKRFFKDSDAGVRLSTFLGGFDLTLNYLYHYADLPVFFREIGTETVFRPGYERTHLVGATFSNAFGDLTVRGELGYGIDRYFPTENTSDRDGAERANEFSYVLGLDWYGLENSLISVQLFQNTLSRSDVIRDDFETTFTLLLRRNFLNESLVAETIWLHNVDHGDGLLRPKVKYSVNDTLDVWLGLDFFYGSQNGFFGEYDRNDRFVLGCELGF